MVLRDVYTDFWRRLESFSSSASPSLKASEGADTETSRLGKLTWFAAVQGELGEAQIPAAPKYELCRCRKRLPWLEREHPAFLGEAADMGHARSSCRLFPPLSPSLLLTDTERSFRSLDAFAHACLPLFVLPWSPGHPEFLLSGYSNVDRLGKRAAVATLAKLSTPALPSGTRTVAALSVTINTVAALTAADTQTDWDSSGQGEEEIAEARSLQLWGARLGEPGCWGLWEEEQLSHPLPSPVGLPGSATAVPAHNCTAALLEPSARSSARSCPASSSAIVSSRWHPVMVPPPGIPSDPCPAQARACAVGLALVGRRGPSLLATPQRQLLVFAFILLQHGHSLRIPVGAGRISAHRWGN
ncbi:hypothetical protein LEMLEM_LOCUS15003 [Lemmus lemmus]